MKTQNSLSRTDRLIRGWIIAAGANIFGAASHGLASGHLPHPLLWLLCTALSAMVCVTLSGVRLPRVGMLVSVLLSQALLHTLYSLSGGTAHVSGAHQAHMMHSAASPMMAQSHMSPTPAMVIFHLCAAALTFGILNWGEQTSARIKDAFSLRIAHWVKLPALPVIARAQPTPVLQVRPLLILITFLQEVHVLRGPPVLVFSLI